jgi:Zn-dependent peptidase ImmA (M78 family)
MIKDGERIIYTNSSQILARENFSIAHELGHHKLHLTPQGITVIRDNDFKDRDDNETEANYFAACLLMPKDMVEKFIRLEMAEKPFEEWTGLDVASIQTAFGVSYDMALLRLKLIFHIKKSVSDYLESKKSKKQQPRC